MAANDDDDAASEVTEGVVAEERGQRVRNGCKAAARRAPYAAGMERVEHRLSAQIVSREAMSAAGASGNKVERVTLEDGRRLVCKRVSPTWDWISRATGDDGRALRMWEDGLFDRVPASIEHSVVAVEPEDDGWAVYMRDVSASMIAPDRRLGREEVRRVLAAVSDLHMAFWGERHPGLCALPQRYNLLSPGLGRSEQALGNGMGGTIGRCWEVFAELAPPAIAEAIVALAEDPGPLAAQLDACEPTLVHGDVRLANLGLAPDAVVLVDWGERTGTAPAAVELASFLMFDARRFDVAPDEVVADFRALYGDRVDDRSMDLALVGGLVQLGCHIVLDVVLHGTEEAMDTARHEMAWWSAQAARAFERTWAP